MLALEKHLRNKAGGPSPALGLWLPFCSPSYTVDKRLFLFSVENPVLLPDSFRGRASRKGLAGRFKQLHVTG